MKQDTLDLDEGVLLMQWPANISLSSLEEVRGWLDFQLKRMESRANKTRNESPEEASSKPQKSDSWKDPGDIESLL